MPSSGGGLISGIAQAIKLQKPDTKVIAVSMERGPSMYESLKKGKPVDVEELETLADCLGGSIGLNNKYTFNIAKKTIDDFVLIDEDKIAKGIKYNFEKINKSSKIKLESSGLVSNWMWYFQRNDVNKRNEWSNYTNWPYENIIPNNLTKLDLDDSLVFYNINNNYAINLFKVYPKLKKIFPN